MFILLVAQGGSQEEKAEMGKKKRKEGRDSLISLPHIST